MHSYPVTRPAAPGLYESERVGDLVAIRLDAEGTASVIIETPTATHETAIIDFGYFVDEYGPFRRLDGGA